MPKVVSNIVRPALQEIDPLAALGVATVHEVQGRTGLLHPRVQSRQQDLSICGTALTCEVAPGDNWMIHVALEQAQPGDILVVTPTSECDDGYFGDLLATSAMARGIRGIIIDAGVRDIADLRQMGFPVWSKTIHAQGTIKETVANVQTPIVCANQLINPGDAIVADDDGVCVVPKDQIATVIEAGCARARAEEEKRQIYATGKLSLDVTPSLRNRLTAAGLVYE